MLLLFSDHNRSSLRQQPGAAINSKQAQSLTNKSIESRLKADSYMVAVMDHLLASPMHKSDLTFCFSLQVLAQGIPVVLKRGSWDAWNLLEKIGFSPRPQDTQQLSLMKHEEVLAMGINNTRQNGVVWLLLFAKISCAAPVCICVCQAPDWYW